MRVDLHCGSFVGIVFMVTFPVSLAVAWEHPTAVAQGVTGYRVYLDDVLAASPTGLTATVSVADPGVHTVQVSAVNLDGESARTAAVQFIGIPDAPITLTITR